MLRLGQVANAELMEDPYPHVAVSNSLNALRELDDEFPGRDQFGPTIRMDGDLTAGDPGYEELLSRSSAYANLHRQVYSPEFLKVFLDLFRVHIAAAYAQGELLFNPLELNFVSEPVEKRLSGRSFVGGKDLFLYPRLDIGYGGVGYGVANGGRGIHIDNVPRLISILIFLNTPQGMVGGAHRLYGLEGDTPFLKKVFDPVAGLLIASLQSNRAFHDVDPILHIDGERRAFYAAISCSEPIWKKEKDAKLSKLSKNRYDPLPPRSVRKVGGLRSLLRRHRRD